MYVKKLSSFCWVLNWCTQTKIGSFFLPHGVVERNRETHPYTHPFNGPSCHPTNSVKALKESHRESDEPVMLGYAPKQKTMLIELNYYWDRGDNFFLGGRDSRTFQNLPTTTTTTTLPASGGILRDRTPVPECEFVDLSQSRMSRWQAWTPWWCTAETRAQVRPESHDLYTHQTTVHISDAPRWIHLGTGASSVTWPLHTTYSQAH